VSSTRSYRQNCSLARALDVVGERWTLLIIRELARGPKRFTDLESGLRGIGANLLAGRLKRLEAAAIITRVESAPGISAYGLTEHGEGLTAALQDLIVWGSDLLEPPSHDAETRAAWAAMSMQAWMNRRPDVAPDGTYAFTVGDEAFWLRVSDRGSQLRDGVPPYPADAGLSLDRDAFFSLATGQRDLDHTEAEIQGDERRLEKLLETFRLPMP
jgi:DNA-binding HxlR family transcriptional regulator